MPDPAAGCSANELEGGIVKSLHASVLVVVSAALSLAAVPAGAAAQFTAALVPAPAPPKVDTAAQADSAREAAKELEERMTSIKEWVDSAAAALASQPAAVPPVPPDTARIPKMPPRPDSSRAPKSPPDTSALRSRRPPG
jgi:hypothetical protein